MWAEGAERFVALANLVENVHRHRFAAENDGDRTFFGCSHFVALRHGDGQYRWRDGSLGQLLALAKKTGPLFGMRDVECGGVSGDTVREPVEAWRAAAGAALLATRLRAFGDSGSVDDAREVGMALDDDLVYFCTAMLGKDSGELYSCWQVNHFFDEGVPSVYWPILRQAAGEQFTEGSFGTSFESFVGPHSHVSNAAARRVERVEGNVFFCGGQGTEPGLLSVERGGILSFRTFVNVTGVVPELRKAPCLISSQANMLDDDRFFGVALEASKVLLTDIIAAHRRGVVSSSRAGQTTSPSFPSTLERLWTSYADSLANGRTGVCRYCGKVFLPTRNGEQLYCSPECQESRNRRAQNEKRRKWKSVREKIESARASEEITADRLYLDFLRSIGRDEIEELLASLSEGADSVLVRVRSENGRGVYKKRQRRSRASLLRGKGGGNAKKGR